MLERYTTFGKRVIKGKVLALSWQRVCEKIYVKEFNDGHFFTKR